MPQANFKKYLNLFFFGTIFLFYGLYIGIDLMKGNFCGNTGVDYCAYWSVGRVINEDGFDHIYNLAELEKFQLPIYSNSFTISKDGLIFPFLYLPIFALPFTALSKIGLGFGFLLYTIINLIATILYSIFFYKRVLGKSPKSTMIMLGIMSIPFFQNILFGQVNLLLLISLAEFVRNLLTTKEEVAGLWLAGWLIKPQTLILVLPYLVYRRKWKLLVIFSGTAFLLLLISFSLVGSHGVSDYLGLITKTSLGGHTSNPFVMANWRMFSLFVSGMIGPNFGTPILVLGTLLTLGTLVTVVRKADVSGTSIQLQIWLFLVCATLLITWHSHLSMSIILLPLIFVMEERGPFRNFLIPYFVLPIVLFIVVYFGQGFHFLNLPFELTNNMLGFLGFVLNSGLFIMLAIFLLLPTRSKEVLK